MNYRSIILLVLSGVLVVGCNTTNESGDDTNEQSSKSKPRKWDWSSYSQASELKLRVLPVDIQPKQSFDIQSQSSGVITLNVAQKVSVVVADEIIAEIDVASLSEQTERLRIDEKKQVLENLRAEELERPEKRRQAQEELKEARRKLKLQRMIIKNPAMVEISAELYGSDVGDVSSASLKDAEEGLALAERKMAWADEFEGKIRAGQLRLQEMDLAKNKRNLEKAKDRSIYRVPFSGELRLEVNFIEGQSEYTVSARETIATLNDYEEIHAHVTIANADWINLDPQQLYLQLTDRNKTAMSFLEDKVEKDTRTQREVRKYIYYVPLEENVELKRLSGTQMNAELIYKLPSVCHIVPKYDLSLYALGKTTTLNWREMVEQLWPGAKVLAEGQKDVAIDYPLPE